MPSLPPGPAGAPLFTIAQLEGEVILRLENRVTDTSRADVWLRDSLLEISGNTDYRDDFDQLEIYGNKFNLTGGPRGIAIQEYPFANFIQTSASNYNIATLDVLIWMDFPTNLIRQKLNPSHYQDADNFQTQPSLPTEWYRFSDFLGFNPPPNQNYQVQIRMLQQHPINDVQLNQTQILIPREWNEVLIWSAVMRGFMELLQFEKASQIRTMLQGDPKFPGKPGMIEAIKKRRKREAWRQEIGLRPVLRGYGAGTTK